MKHIFIVNPAAGKCDRTEQIREEVHKLFRDADGAVEIQVSQKPGDCARLAKEACETGEPVRLYACGGDGTLNEVVSGAVGYDNASVTHYPSGSGNDFIKLFDDPQAFRSLERLMDCDQAQMDLIECRADGKMYYGANIASIGLDARIGTQMGRYRRLPFVSGTGAYYLSTAVNLCKGIHRPYEIHVGDEVISDDQTLVCVCNGRFYGGGFNPVPDAEPDDGMLDVLIVKKVNLLQVAKVIGHYKGGRYALFPELIRHLRTDKIRIVCRKESVINLDGEGCYGTDIEFAVSQHKLRFFYPKGLSYHAKKEETLLAGVD